jgi:Ulp1 protease family, C-terminal catalytic domain
MDSQLQDILIKLRCEKYQNFHYINHSTTKKMIDGLELQTEKFVEISHRTFVTAYCVASHWYLIVIDIDRKLFIIVDPKNPQVIIRKEIWMANIVNVLKTDLQLPDDRWKFGFVMPSQVQLPQQGIEDSVNCGIFVIAYVDLMFGKCSIQDPTMLRSIYRSEILETSMSMINFCLFCGKNLEKIFFKLMCLRCRRWLCCKCVKISVENEKFECFFCKNNPFAP